MAKVTEVFDLDNSITMSFKTGGAEQQGICTAASFLWAKQTLRLGRCLTSADEISKDFKGPLGQITIGALMSTLRHKDALLESKPDEYLEPLGLTSVTGATVLRNFADLEALAKNNAPHIAVFWNSHHTMGYRYHHHDKEYFDMEAGLYKAKLTRDIDAKMQEIWKAKKYAVIDKGIVVKLAD